VTAPAAGTGKSHLVDVIVTAATGECCPVIAATSNPTEMDKRLDGIMLKGVLTFSIDNVHELHTTDTLCQVTERPVLELRPLGVSDMVTTGNAVTPFATGNNARARGDMIRRHLRSELDANTEHPETRVFRNRDLLNEVKANRGKYIAAALTVLRAYIVAGKPNPPPPLGSYTAWSGLVRAALIWLDQPDPVSTMHAGSDDDPDTLPVKELLAAWPLTLGGQSGCTVSDLLTAMGDWDSNRGEPKYPGLQEAIARVAADKVGIMDRDAFGRWLRDNKGRVLDGRKLIRVGVTNKRTRWRVVTVKKP
jgi:putative DNA primase/helicase